MKPLFSSLGGWKTLFIRFGAFSLDSESYVLSNGTEPVSLDPQGFSVLLYLLEHRQRVVSKDELIEHVWEGRIVSDAAITSAINLVRRAVDDDGKTQAIIKTFPRRGFRFVAEVEENNDDDTPGITGKTPSAPTSDKPSIAVLPFDNLSNDTEQEFFCDGVVEAIITDLSRLTGISVIARNSSFTYKGKSIDIRDVARELNISHVLEGSVQKSANRVRISAQLIDAISNTQIWAERYDGNLDDIFALQDEISQKIVSSLQINLDVAEAERLSSNYIPVKEAFDYFVRGKSSVHPPTPENLKQGRINFKKALEIDPKFAGGYAGSALVSAFEHFIGRISSTEFDPPPDSDLKQAEQAISIDPNFGWAYIPLSMTHLLRGDHDLAIQAISNGLVVSPGDADLNAYMCYMLHLNRRGEEACEFGEIARRLDSHNGTYTAYHAYAKFVLGEHADAIDIFENQVPVDRYSAMTFTYLIVAHVRDGNLEQAKAAADLATSKYPFMSVNSMRNFIPWAYEQDRANLSDDLSKVL